MIADDDDDKKGGTQEKEFEMSIFESFEEENR